MKIDTIMGGGLHDAPAEAAAAWAAGYARWTSGLADRTSFTPPETIDADAARELVSAVRAYADELTANVRG